MATRVAADLEEIVAWRDRFHPEATGPDPLQSGLHLRAGVQRRPAAGRLDFDRAGSVRGAHTGSPDDRVVRVDPIACAGKGITGQGDTLWLIAVQLRPVHLDACRPQLSQREQEGVAVVPALQRMAHQPDRAVVFRPARHPHSRSGQTAAGSHLDENAERIPEQCLHLFGEAHGRADLPGPPIRIRGLLVGHPRPGHVGQHRDSGDIQGQSRQVLGERGDHRVHRL